MICCSLKEPLKSKKEIICILELKIMGRKVVILIIQFMVVCIFWVSTNLGKLGNFPLKLSNTN